MGLIFTTSGWTGASITFAHADGTETYTVTGDVLNPYDVAQALVAWLDDAGRVWSAHVSGVAFTVTQDGARDQIGLTYTGTFTSGVLAAASDLPSDLELAALRQAQYLYILPHEMEAIAQNYHIPAVR